jgi:hypothetical protein
MKTDVGDASWIIRSNICTESSALTWRQDTVWSKLIQRSGPYLIADKILVFEAAQMTRPVQILLPLRHIL